MKTLYLMLTPLILCYAAQRETKLKLNYQKYSYDLSRSKVDIELDYCGPYNRFEVVFFNKMDITNGRFFSDYVHKLSSPQISVDDGTFFKLVVRDENGTDRSDDESANTYYRVMRKGMYIYASVEYGRWHWWSCRAALPDQSYLHSRR